MAATYPVGEFYGIDMMPAHVDHGTRLATEAGVPNAKFLTAEFERVAKFDLPDFDYIVLHGVYTWISTKARANLRAFIGRHLKPGGLVYISYNALPGRAADLPFQRLVRALADRTEGDSTARVEVALKTINSLRELGVEKLVSSPMLDRINRPELNYSMAYVAHELLAEHWEPISVSDLRREMTGLQLLPVGSATLIENYDTLMLRKPELEALAAIAPEIRELVRDYFINQTFRRDVFCRNPEKLTANDQIQLMLDSAFGLIRRPSQIKYATRTRAGMVSFDSSVARRIVAGLASGPRRIGKLANDLGITAEEALAAVLLLSVSGQVLPTEPDPVDVTTFNAAVRGRLNGPEEIAFLATSYGAHIHIDQTAREILSNGANNEHEQSWRELLAAHGFAILLP
jgi:SAM-dependent methyltransferase